ncbi:MAG: 30S ribosomal protein S1 [Planctomycetes bacterium]|nr:30S ribosomal protein S1 [Planctomycetota bacterium]
MVNRNLLRELVSDQDIELEMARAFARQDSEAGEAADIENWLRDEKQTFDANKLVNGRVANIVGDKVIVDIGYKSEGEIPLDEWREEGVDNPVFPKVGDEVQVLLDSVEDESGTIQLSFRKARRQREWESIIQKHKEGDVVDGLVTKKIKGGLLVNIGVNVFLPASQVDIRRPPDIGDYIGRTIQCKILKIDEPRRNIVVSRRKLLEDQREEMKRNLLSEIAAGQVRKGIVKNIADFGAFVDLGGIDGLLHITDMTWGRISNPHEIVRIDQPIEVYIISVDRDREKIALGLKQKTASPWSSVQDKYPVGSKHMGEVVNVMSYGAFVKLESGIEGLVHISEMSWTKRINHPSELVSVGEQVEVQVLNINRDKQEISLGMKQVQSNPWDKVAERYPKDTVVTGVVRNLTNYGAFVEIEEGIDGLLHVSDMSWVRKVTHPSEVLQKGDTVTCVVLNVDQERKRIALGLKQMKNDPWDTDIPARYRNGEVKTGKVTKITNFGVFIELEPGLEGLLHISELSDQKIDNPESLVNVGDDMEVKILRVDVPERKIGLSRKRLGWTAEEDEANPPAPAALNAGGSGSSTPAAPAAAPARQSRELRGGTGSGGNLIEIPPS